MPEINLKTILDHVAKVREARAKAMPGPWLHDELTVLQDVGIQPHICYMHGATSTPLTDRAVENAEFIALAANQTLAHMQVIEVLAEAVEYAMRAPKSADGWEFYMNEALESAAELLKEFGGSHEG